MLERELAEAAEAGYRYSAVEADASATASASWDLSAEAMTRCHRRELSQSADHHRAAASYGWERRGKEQRLSKDAPHAEH